jgi:hypothetical protein
VLISTNQGGKTKVHQNFSSVVMCYTLARRGGLEFYQIFRCQIIRGVVSVFSCFQVWDVLRRGQLLELLASGDRYKFLSGEFVALRHLSFHMILFILSLW